MGIRDYFTCPERPKFLTFGLKVNAAMVRHYGLSLMDLPDQDYSSLFEEWDGTDEHAREIAEEIVADELEEMLGF